MNFAAFLNPLHELVHVLIMPQIFLALPYMANLPFVGFAQLGPMNTVCMPTQLRSFGMKSLGVSLDIHRFC